MEESWEECDFSLNEIICKDKKNVLVENPSQYDDKTQKPVDDNHNLIQKNQKLFRFTLQI